MEGFSAQWRQTRDFAAQTTTTIRIMCPDAPDYVAEAAIRKSVWKAKIATPGDKPVDLTVDGKRLLRLNLTARTSTTSAAPRFWALGKDQQFTTVLGYPRNPWASRLIALLSVPQATAIGHSERELVPNVLECPARHHGPVVHDTDVRQVVCYLCLYSEWCRGAQPPFRDVHSRRSVTGTGGWAQ